MPPDVLARVERVLAERNVDGKVPTDIAVRLLDKMAQITAREPTWSCEQLRRYGLHSNCHRHLGDE